MDYLQAKGGVIADLGANGGAIRRYASTPSAASSPRRPYVSPITNSAGRHRRPLHADVGDVTTMTVTPATSERRARTQEDMRTFVSGMTRATRDRQQQDKQQYYFGAPPPSTPTTPSQVGSGFISNGAFYNGVVELSRRPDGGSGGSGAGLIAGSLQPARKQVPAKGTVSLDDDGDDLPLPPPPPLPTHEAADEIQAVERLFREAMAVADERRQQQQLKNGSRTPPPARTLWEQRAEGILVREVDDARPCLSCQDGCPTGYKQHPWRKTCHSCKCPREQHDVYHEEWVNVRERLGFRLDVDQDPDRPTRGSKERSQAEGYSWVPPGLPSHKISEYFGALPAAKRPLLGSPGEKHRDRQLVLQLPKQDLALAYCRHVEQQHTASYEDFIHARNEIALDIGYVQDHASQDLECPECGQTVAAHEVAVVAPKLGANLRWHPACFTCSQCNELLVDLTYCVHDDALFCERHYAEQLKPRCSSCDETKLGAAAAAKPEPGPGRQAWSHDGHDGQVAASCRAARAARSAKVLCSREACSRCDGRYRTSERRSVPCGSLAMGLLLSVLVVCVGVFEALDCYYHFRAGLLPAARAAPLAAAPSGWRSHLTNLNERWRRKPSAALTWGGGGGGVSGGGGDSAPSSSAGDDALGKNALQECTLPPPGSPGHCQLNGHGSRPPPRWLNSPREDTLGNGSEIPRSEESPAALNIASPERNEEADLKTLHDSNRGPSQPPAHGEDGAAGSRSRESRRSSSADRPVSIPVAGAETLLGLPEASADAPRRLSEAFPEAKDLPPASKESLRVDVDLPRRISEIEVDVPSPLPDSNPDQPRRLSDFAVPNRTSSPAVVERPQRPQSRRNTLSPQYPEEDLPRRASESFSGSEPTSPTRKSSKVDIRWPSFTPLHPAHKSTLFRLEDVMSIDVEDDVFVPSPQKVIPKSSAMEENHPQMEEKMSIADVSHGNYQNLEYKQLTDFLSFLDEHIHQDDCMNLWNSVQSSDTSSARCSKKCSDSVENPSRQYLELQEFLKRQYVDAENSSNVLENVALSRDSPVDSEVEIQKLVAPTLSSDANESKREYMDLLNFLYLLRAQEETPEEPLLQEYFERRRQEEFLTPQSNNLNSPSANKFKEYEQLMQFLKSLPSDSTCPSTKIVNIASKAIPSAPTKSGSTLPLKSDCQAEDETALCSELPLRSPTHSELVTVSTEPQRLQMPVRSQSFEAATPELTDSAIKAALEASASRGEEGEDAEVASITAQASQRQNKDESSTNVAPTNGHPSRSGSATPIPAQISSPDDQRTAPVQEQKQNSAGPSASQPPQHAQQPEAFWLIFSGEYTKAMSKDWHAGHFCCWQCDESLTGQRYVLRDEHPYCIKCYESVFANTCEECSKTIGIDSKDLSYKDKHWHEACFLCSKCRVSLVDKQFGSKADHIYCGNCYDAQFASRCDGCGEIFRAGTKKMEYKTRQWHEKCFCCVVCKTAIGTKSFIPREQEIYCATCYEEKFATRCVKCNKIITSGGVTYKNEPWHRECFTCTNCNTSLAGQRFTSRDEKPYCADCFGELFAKRCTACVKPITGIGGTRFISFEDRHWHNDCFICASCKTSLVGRGFITDADDIICPECAKQKLM